ncbi:MAG: hypothetical protein OXC26_22380 [Albidovulum sp.]|nr:hypothetical protein [Albidovulum sp.]
MTAFGNSAPEADPASLSAEASARPIGSNSGLARQFADRDDRIAKLLERNREPSDEFKRLQKLSSRPASKPRAAV